MSLPSSPLSHNQRCAVVAALIVALIVAGGMCVTTRVLVGLFGSQYLDRSASTTPAAPTATSVPQATSRGAGTPPKTTEEAAAPSRGGTLRLPGGSPTTLDPVQVRDVASARYVYEIFSGLVTLTPELEVIPDLAESWQVSPGGEVYTFTLRSNLRFQDGQPLGAEDVAFTIERACDPRTGSPVAETYLGDIVGCAAKLAGRAPMVSGVRVVDAKHLVITIDGPKRYFLAKLANPTSFVVDRRQVAQTEWWRKPNGSGPFRVAKYEKDVQLVLERNELYYRQPPFLDRVEFDLRPVTLSTRYENGELDAMPISPDERERLSDPLNPLSAQMVDGPAEMGLSYIGFHVRIPPFDDRHVRRALNYALDKKRLARVVLRGGVKPAYWILPPGMPGHDPSVQMYTFDPERARQELAASRYRRASALPPLTLHTSGEGGGDPVDLAIAEMLGDVLGVEVTVEQAPWELFQRELEGGAYGMYTLGWAADYPDPQDFLDVLFHSRSPLNHSGYANPQVDGWLEQARTEADEASRMALYRKAEQQILADAVWLPLFTGFESWLVAPHVRGFRLAPLVVPQLAGVWLARERQ